MINITIENDEIGSMKPEKMLTERWDHGTIFQLHINGEPDNTYFIHCGINEKRMIMIWYSEEGGRYLLSTQSLSDLREYNSHISVRIVDKDVDINVGNRH